MLAKLLERGEIVIHPFIVGELALGSLAGRGEVLDSLKALPTIGAADPNEILLLIEKRQLFGTGIGYVDASLLGATLVMNGALLWTNDRRLHAASLRLDIAFDPSLHA